MSPHSPTEACWRRARVALLAALTLAACGGGDAEPEATTSPDSGADVAEERDTADDGAADTEPPDAEPDTADAFEPPDPETLPEYPGGDRPSPFVLPANYEPGRAWPLVIQLHGFGVNAFLQDLMLRTGELVDELGFILLTPEGTPDPDNEQFWNASDVCCNFYDADVDDVAYLNVLIDEAQTRWHVDPERIHVLGHSNGGFMTYRFACDAGERLAGVMSLAGDMALDPASCDHPVNVLHVHGTADDVIYYEGGPFRGTPSPGARASAEAWAGINGCDGGWVEGARLDVSLAVEGAETRVEAQSGCASGASVALWTIEGGVHVPAVDAGFMREVLGVLLAQRRLP